MGYCVVLVLLLAAVCSSWSVGRQNVDLRVLD